LAAASTVSSRSTNSSRIWQERPASRFFYERALKSLIYAAPFAVPLAYTGLGLLLVMNRMVDRRSAEWPRWVLFLGLGGCSAISCSA